LRIRFDHKTIENGLYHVITSPDVKGLCATAGTLREAEQEALAQLSLIREARGEAEEKITALELEATAQTR
jgi:predicted RNase H-like HicB family nuclease